MRARAHRIDLRLDDAEHDMLVELARQRGLSESVVLRTLIREASRPDTTAARPDIVRTPKPTATTKPKRPDMRPDIEAGLAALGISPSGVAENPYT